ncbi:MAG: NAD-dependent epimerase/dehydratase family protein [Salinisphaeraceae bacterium]
MTRHAFVTGGSGFIGRNLIRALIDTGCSVRALVRSDAAADAVTAAGADPLRGDLHDRAAMTRGMTGCDWVFHAAAKVEEWGDPADYEYINVDGTKAVLAAAAEAGVRRLVHVSTEAVLADGSHLHNADETWPRPANPLPRYPRTKARAEAAVEAANGDHGLETVIVRPTSVWGAGDTSVLPKIAAAVASGRFMWIGGGDYPRATTHVRNLCEILLLAAEKGRPGGCYFATDGEPARYRDFLTAELATLGVAPPSRSIPRPVAKAVANACDAIWNTLGLANPPPVSRLLVTLFGSPVTIDDSLARRELGYVGRVTREAGLAEMANQSEGGA